MAFFRMKVGDKLYELDKLTLGDACIMKRDFSMLDLTEFNPADPEQVMGLFALAMVKQDGISLTEAKKRASEIDVDGFEAMQEEEKPEVDPTKGAAGAKEATGSRAKGGKSAKRPKAPGTQH